VTAARTGASISKRLSETPPYSYRADPAVPRFADDKAVLVFDGVCVLCSGFARFILKRDAAFAFRLVTAQSPLGQALLRHSPRTTSRPTWFSPTAAPTPSSTAW